jgi:hypothetical protein
MRYKPWSNQLLVLLVVAPSASRLFHITPIITHPHDLLTKLIQRPLLEMVSHGFPIRIL